MTEIGGQSGPDISADEPLGTHVLQLEIADVIRETDDACSLVFAVPGGAEDPAIPAGRLRYAPGQFLTLRIPSETTGSVARCYSLCSSPFTDDALAIAVKRTVGGYASNWLCDNAHIGMRVHVLAPSGTFVPTSLDGSLLLMAAGSGITPVLSICKSALAQGSGPITLIYANRNEDSVMFADTLRQLAARHPDRLTVLHWLESLQGLPSAAALAAMAAAHSDRSAYICGPAPFMRAASEALTTLGVPGKRIHMEVFRSLDSDPFAAVTIDADADADESGPATAVVALDGTTTTVSWPRRAVLLDALLAAGLDAPFSCREGHCGACVTTLRSGKVTMDRNDVLVQQDLDEKLILACQSHPESDSVEVSYDD